MAGTLISDANKADFWMLEVDLEWNVLKNITLGGYKDQSLYTIIERENGHLVLILVLIIHFRYLLGIYMEKEEWIFI